jgi:hypothetical protein
MIPRLKPGGGSLNMKAFVSWSERGVPLQHSERVQQKRRYKANGVVTAEKREILAAFF